MKFGVTIPPFTSGIDIASATPRTERQITYHPHTPDEKGTHHVPTTKGTSSQFHPTLHSNSSLQATVLGIQSCNLRCSCTMVKQYKFLTQDQIDHFMKYGYLRIPQAFSREKAASWTSTVWTRLGYDPNDKSTWLRERINMPNHKFEPVRTFSPLAWGCICELLGGEDRVDDFSTKWSDGLIVNLGAPEWENNWQPPKKLENWHVDGDFFLHFLDSREQALLVIPVFTEIKPHGGGTMIAPEGIKMIAKHLHDHPEGVLPGGFGTLDKIKECEYFHEITGSPGDVVLMHPLMMHSASRNALRIPRIITNPPVLLKEPFNFDREDPDDYSIVEKKTLKELGVNRLPGWRIKGERRVVVPERVRIQAEMRAQELKRLAGASKDGTSIGGLDQLNRVPTTEEILSM